MACFMLNFKRHLIPVLISLWIIPLVLFNSCFFEEDNEPSYPKISQDSLVGCWFATKTEPGTCVEICYDQNLNFYRTFNSIDSLNQYSGSPSHAENLGLYKIIGRNTIEISFEARTDDGRLPWQAGYTQNFAVIKGKLNDIELQSATYSLAPYIRSDSTHHCQPHWQMFAKPSNWGLQ